MVNPTNSSDDEGLQIGLTENTNKATITAESVTAGDNGRITIMGK